MFKEFWRELLLAAVLSALLFLVADVLGEFFVPPTEEITFSSGLMVLSLAVLVLPALLGSIPSGFLIARKTKDIKAAVFVPAAGAAIGGLFVMALSVASLFLMTDVAWQEQIDALADYGADFFAGMPLEEYKALMVFSLAFGAVFLAIMNFAIGLAGGFVGSRIAKGKK